MKLDAFVDIRTERVVKAVLTAKTAADEFLLKELTNIMQHGTVGDEIQIVTGDKCIVWRVGNE